jgi:hypothetical protein
VWQYKHYTLMDGRKVARNYLLRGGFWMDALSVIPTIIQVGPACRPDDRSCVGSVSHPEHESGLSVIPTIIQVGPVRHPTIVHVLGLSVRHPHHHSGGVCRSDDRSCVGSVNHPDQESGVSVIPTIIQVGPVRHPTIVHVLGLSVFPTHHHSSGVHHLMNK